MYERQKRIKTKRFILFFFKKAMIKKIYILFLLVCSSYVFSQPCKDQLISDSLFKPNDNSTVAVSSLNCALKNGGGIQFLNQNGKYFLKIKPNQKIGFDEKGSLELKSGSKSFFVKNAILIDAKKPEPYFVVDIQLNYVATLKESGLTSLIFNTFEVKFAKQDVENIRETAKCFYSLNNKK